MRWISHSFRAAGLSIAVATAAIAAGYATASAQQSPAPAATPIEATAPPGTAQPPTLPPTPPAAPAGPPTSGLQVIVYPYLWLGGINTTIKTPLERAPEVNSSVGPFQLFGHLDAVPFMGAAEVRDGPFSLLANLIHVPVGTNITTRNIFFNGGNAALTANIGSTVFLYHALDEPVQTIDGGVGFRSWGFSSRLTLNGGLLPGANVTSSTGWADPLIAGRYHREFGNGFGLTAYGDVGGFGVAAHSDWQIVGTLDYTVKPSITLRLGYASLNVNYQGGGALGFIIHMKGPILTANIRF